MENSAAAHELALQVVTGLERLIGLFRTLSAPNELSLTAVATMATLERAGPVRLTSLAGSEGVTQPAMTQLVTRLQDMGLAERVTDPDDGRAVQVRITQAGQALLASRRAARAERLVTLLDRLSDAERDALTAALPAITALTGQ
jgi:DNA-binding MarR family transcriptional regulator